ncbi:MAG: oligopeptide transporter, OPT family [Dysgonamonadaceae bacterium]|jgi:putative OPT family oligopeptide transporter|nr:oligopeptide transporter, OPT family [Dysgonamonadaceae bacterium]
MSEDKKFIPFVSSDTNMKEFTVRALLVGLVLAVVLGAANAYLGLKAGMTIAATYPAAVIGMAVLRFFKGSILEENFTRTVGSIGESVAAGAIFTLPAFYIAGIWSGEEFSSLSSYLTASLILVTGGTLGVLFVALLRRVMVEDKELPFPESVAAAEIHKTGQSGAGGSKYLFSAMIVGAVVKIAGDLRLFATEWTHFFKAGTASFAKGKATLEGGFLAGGPSISPAYLGVGYIIGPRLSALNFSGSVMAWGLMVPMLLMMLGSSFVASLPVNEGMDVSTSVLAWENAANVVWREIVRIIAIGGMLVAACFTLYRMRSSLGTGLKRSVKDLKRAAQGTSESIERTEKDLKSSWILIGICMAAVLTFIITYFLFHTSILVAIVASTVMIILAFFFAAVSGYLVGIIGSSNNPISGLTLTALVVTALILVACGVKGSTSGVAAVLGIAAIVCVAAAVGGEMFQDLKAGHLLGGTPWRMQVGDIIGVIISGFVMFGVLIVLNQGDINMGIQQGYEGGFGSKNLSAPQAGLMATLSQGIVGGQMAWSLIIAGMVLGVAFILMGIKSPMLIFVGMYLPFSTVFAIFAGGLIKGILDLYVARRKYNEGQLATVENTGVLLASGMIAGEALMGLVVAVFAMFNIFFSDMLPVSHPLYGVGLAIVIVIAYFFVKIPLKKADSLK